MLCVKTEKQSSTRLEMFERFSLKPSMEQMVRFYVEYAFTL